MKRPTERAVEMTDEEIARFLERAGVGVLSFAGEDGAYGVPMSFAYDRDLGVAFFQFETAEGGEKMRYARTDRTVCLTAFEWHSVDDWRSVVVRGSFRRVPDPVRAERAMGLFATQAKVTELEIFEPEAVDLDFVWYELDAEETTGLHARE